MSISIEILLIVLAFIMLLIGLFGAVLPILPGPPLSLGGLLLLHFGTRAEFSEKTLWFYVIITIIVTIIDYLLPVWGTKKTGGSKHGVFGATIGLVIGIFFFPPFGLIIWPFIGAFVAELVNGAQTNRALKSAIGSFLGLVTGTLLKLIVSALMIFHAIKALI